MSMRNVLGVLEDEPDRLWSTFRAAVDLAQRERSRLTLVKTRASGHVYVWCAPFAIGGAYLPPEADPEVTSGRLLARAAEFVPMDIPVTTIVLGLETERELRRLIRSCAFDAMVADERRFKRAGRLRRECARHDVQRLSVHSTPQPEPATQLVASVLSGAI